MKALADDSQRGSVRAAVLLSERCLALTLASMQAMARDSDRAQVQFRLYLSLPSSHLVLESLHPIVSAHL